MGEGQEELIVMSAKETGSPKSLMRGISIFFALQIAILSFCSAASSTETGNCRVVLLGASYAKDWPISTIGRFSVINKGIGGNQSFEMADRFRADVVSQDADAVIIWGFINDIFRAPPEQSAITKERILDSYSSMVANARENGIRPIIATEVSIREPAGIVSWVAGIVGRLRGKASYQTIINGHVFETNASLRELAAKHDVEVLDFFDVLSDENGIRHQEYATDDGSHISSLAYARLTNYVSDNFPGVCESSD